MEHDITRLNAALAGARLADMDTTKFFAGGVEYRLTNLADEPGLIWDVWVGAQGDLLVDKRDGNDLIRPAQTLNEGHPMVAIERAALRHEDAFLRRRCQEWVAAAFHGPPPTPGAIVKHLNGAPTDNRKENLRWCGPPEVGARRTAHAGGGAPEGKPRELSVGLSAGRTLPEGTRLKARALAEYLEALILQQLEDKLRS